MTPAGAALLRAERLLTKRVEELAARLDSGDETAWPHLAEAADALAAVAAAVRPEVGGAMLTTAQLAERLQLSPRTILRRAKRGELEPLRLGQRGRGAVRWRA